MKGTSGDGLLYALYCKIKSWYIREGLKVGYEWSEFEISRKKVLKNIILKTKCLITAETLYSFLKKVTADINLKMAHLKPLIFS